MSYTTRTVNAQGLAEIRAILAANHKLGGEHFTDSMIQAWANEAQFQLDEGNEASIEIKSRDHISGHTQEFRLSDAAIDTQTVEGEDE
jgi:hypothetical protein